VSAAAHAHFANPRNDFWRLLHASRLTARLYEPVEQFELLHEGIGVTNAAARTTPGSGDLRKRDFDRERLERMAAELTPRWIAFVGKEAYRGTFGERPELGIQGRTLGETQLFVLPSTSPANAAVPWSERLLWFKELAGRASGLPWRPGVRALVLERGGRTILLRYGDDYSSWWATPGGGKDAGESDERALRRELREELGLEEYELGPLLWTREQWFVDEPGYGGQRENVYLVRVPAAFEPAPELDLTDEGCQEQRWFTADELEGLTTRPADLAERLRSASGS
jgi:G:T/U-mismatch repair DNA glycosylase/ADP-ribose pyrophosphatase YjhB (NUDIX family)